MKLLKQLISEQYNKTKTQKEMVSIFSEKLNSERQDVHNYKKSGSYDVRLAKDGEKINTNINGENETTNTAKKDEVVIRGPEGEEYLISIKKFKDRYIIDKPLSKDFQKYQAKGLIKAYKYKGKDFKFMAEWGEEMICKDGDYLACTVENDSDTIKNIYRIEKNIFNKTYNKVNKHENN